MKFEIEGWDIIKITTKETMGIIIKPIPHWEVNIENRDYEFINTCPFRYPLHYCQDPETIKMQYCDPNGEKRHICSPPVEAKIAEQKNRELSVCFGCSIFEATWGRGCVGCAKEKEQDKQKIEIANTPKKYDFDTVTKTFIRRSFNA